MKLSILFTLLAALFSSVSAISNTDVTEVLTSEAETASGSSNGFDVCYFHCYLDGGSSDDVQNCIKTRCGGSKASLKGTADTNGSDVFISGVRSNVCQNHCIISEGSFDEALECIRTRCGGVNTENSEEANADSSQVLISNKAVPGLKQHPGLDLNCYFFCLDTGRSDDEIDDCVRTRCGGLESENGDEANADASEVLISEAKTAPGVGLDCYYSCLLQGRSYDEIEYCVRTRCGGLESENGDEANADASEVLISEAETAPGVGLDCYFFCLHTGRSDDEIDDCVRTRCGGVKAENGDEANADASEVAISEVDTAPHPDIVKFQCYYGCFIQGRNDDEVEDCILMKCEGDKAKDSNKGNIDNSDVRISDADTLPDSDIFKVLCTNDCVRALGIDTVSLEDVNQCARECRLGKKESNLRGSIK